MSTSLDRAVNFRQARRSVRPSGPRDSQRAALYGAEQLVRRIFDRALEFPIIEVAGSHLTLPVERKFGSVVGVQAYVDAVLALEWVRAAWPTAGKVRVRERAGESKAHYSDGVIAVPTHQIGSSWALRELVVLHELAHHLSPSVPFHNAAFAGTYIRLVAELIGAEAGLLLRITFHENSVDVS